MTFSFRHGLCAARRFLKVKVEVVAVARPAADRSVQRWARVVRIPTTASAAPTRTPSTWAPRARCLVGRSGPSASAARGCCRWHSPRPSSACSLVVRCCTGASHDQECEVTVRLPLLAGSAPNATSDYSVTPLLSTGTVRLAKGGNIPDPKPGCWWVGTECRVGYQTCKYCCGGGNNQSYTEPCGWCIGWWDAPPCF
jgi:hypothetical protein